MPDFRIVEIVFDNAKVYYRYETVGKSTIGGDDATPYQPHVVQKWFRSTLSQNHSPVELAADVAKHIACRVCCVLNGTEDQILALKAHEVKKAKQAGLYAILNRK